MNFTVSFWLRFFGYNVLFGTGYCRATARSLNRWYLGVEHSAEGSGYDYDSTAIQCRMAVELESNRSFNHHLYLLRLSSSCPGWDIGRRDFSIGVDRWQLSLHRAKLDSFCLGLP